MELKSTSIVNRPLEEVYKLVRDDLTKLVPHLPNVDKIVQAERQPNDQGPKIVNHWYAKAEVPALVKKFVNPNLFSWKDFAQWDDSQYLVNYELESFLGNELFDASGTNSFKAIDENKTELTISCSLTIYPEKVPGVPRLLAKKVTPALESVIEKLLGPNLTSLGEGLNRYFDSLKD